MKIGKDLTEKNSKWLLLNVKTWHTTNKVKTWPTKVFLPTKHPGATVGVRSLGLVTTFILDLNFILVAHGFVSRVEFDSFDVGEMRFNRF